jgi:hypothetical protein
MPVSRFTRALAAASMAVAAAGGGLLIAAAAAVPAHAAAPPGGHAMTITAHPAARAASGTGPQDVLSCPPHEDCLPPITCWLQIGTPFQDDLKRILATAYVHCDANVAEIQMTQDLLSSVQNGGGHTYEDRVETDGFVTLIAVTCQPGSYTNTASALITWPDGYDSPVVGQNPLHGTSDQIIIPAIACNDDVTVPGVLGSSRASAQESLTDAGLTVGNISHNHQCLDSAGSVVGQDPGPGAHVPRGTAVNLDVSTGTDTHNKPCLIQ